MIDLSENEIMSNWNIEKYPNTVVTVRCIAYNHEAFIEECLDGVLAQKTSFPFEVLVHDDVSTDKTADIIRAYEKKYPHIIRPVYETENQYSKGCGALEKVMNPLITGKYVAFCECDDYWCNEYKLQLQFDVMEAHPEYTICFAKTKTVNTNQDYAETFNGKNEIVSMKRILTNIVTGKNEGIHTSTFFLRTSLYLEWFNFRWTERNGFDLMTGDTSLTFYSLMKGDGVIINTLCSCYRWNSGGYITKYSSDFNFRKYVDMQQCLAYKNFDVYTNGKYHKYLKKIIRYHSRISMPTFMVKKLVSEKKYLSAFLPKYWLGLKQYSFVALLRIFFKGILGDKCYNKVKKICKSKE